LQDLLQHVAAGAGDIVGVRLGVEAGAGTQIRLVHRQGVEADIKVGTAFVGCDVPGHVVTCDHVVMPKSRQRSPAPDFDHHL
jgi:hypothetical protein